MKQHTLLTISAFLLIGNALLFKDVNSTPQILATTAMSMENRAMPGSFMAETMRDNILLTLFYMRDVPISASPDWEEVRKPFEFSFKLKPGETYTFQNATLPEYKGTVVKTLNVNFSGQQGYKHDGYLMGDGVCHLASLFYKAAVEAGIHAKAPTNHDFMPIPEVEREFGVSIYSMPGAEAANAQQNLYITNNQTADIEFKVTYDGKNLETKVIETKKSLDTKVII